MKERKVMRDRKWVRKGRGTKEEIGRGEEEEEGIKKNLRIGEKEREEEE